MGWRKGATDLVIDGAKYVGEQVFNIFRGGDAANTTLTKRETIAATSSQASADVYARQHGDGSVVKMRVNAKNPAVFEQQHTTIDAVADQYGLDADDIATLRSRHGDGLIDLRDLSEDDVFVGALKVNGVDLLMHPQPSNNPKMQDPSLQSAGSEGEVTFQIFDHNQIDNVVRISPFHVDELGFFSPARRAIEEMTDPRASGQAFIKAIMKHKGGRTDAEQTGLLEMLEKSRNDMMTREEVLMALDGMRIPVQEVNVGGPKDLRLVSDRDVDDAWREFSENLDVRTPPPESRFGREQVQWERELIDDDKEFFMDDFVEWLNNDVGVDGLPSADKLSQGQKDELINLYWDDFASQRAREAYQNSGYVHASWRAEFEGRYQYSITGNVNDGSFTARVEVLHGPRSGDIDEYEAANVDQAQDWLFREARDNEDVHWDENEGGINEGYTDYTTRGVYDHQEIRLMLPPFPTGSRQKNYHNNHYREANILVHARIGYRTMSGVRYRRSDTADGYVSNVLHIDEIQSDWHQAGEQWGYRAHDGKYTPGWSKEDTGDAHDAIVPDAPFKKNWHELMFKRILTEAVRDPSIGRVSWTTGNQQMQRYPQSVRHLTSLQVTRETMGRTTNEPTYEVEAVDVNGQVEHKLHVPESELHELMGKELADDVARNSDKWDAGEAQSWTELRGMQVGLKGLTNLYDKKLPQYVRKLVKKYGVTPKLSGNEFRIVERHSVSQWQSDADVDSGGSLPAREVRVTMFEVVSGEGDNQKFHGSFTNRNMAEQMIRENDDRVWYIDITEEMREDILKEGLPLTFEEHKTSGRYV